MDSFLLPLALFFSKALCVVVAIIVVIGTTLRIVRATRAGGEDRLEVIHINERVRALAQTLRDNMRPVRSRGLRGWRQRRRERRAARDALAEGPIRPRTFVLDFHGDIAASGVASLREEITAILQVAAEGDAVALRLESPGGVVHGYGLAASELDRLRQRGLPLTVCVDKVAASGGYMMACVGNRILAAPFAVLGSIGVVAQLPNFNRWLKKREIDYELHTAGRFKRTLTLLGENSDEGRAKLTEELEETLKLFKTFVTQMRPQVDIEEVATGETWYGRRALELKLVDALQTSDDYLLECARDRDVYALRFVAPASMRDWLARQFARLSATVLS